MEEGGNVGIDQCGFFCRFNDFKGLACRCTWIGRAFGHAAQTNATLAASSCNVNNGAGSGGIVQLNANKNSTGKFQSIRLDP
jgi:hypothetical protein